MQKPLKVTQEIGEKLNCPEQKRLHFCRAESFVETLKVFLLGMPSTEHGQVNGTARDRKEVGQLWAHDLHDPQSWEVVDRNLCLIGVIPLRAGNSSPSCE